MAVGWQGGTSLGRSVPAAGVTPTAHKTPRSNAVQEKSRWGSRTPSCADGTTLYADAADCNPSASLLPEVALSGFATTRQGPEFPHDDVPDVLWADAGLGRHPPYARVGHGGRARRARGLVNADHSARETRVPAPSRRCVPVLLSRPISSSYATRTCSECQAGPSSESSGWPAVSRRPPCVTVPHGGWRVHAQAKISLRLLARLCWDTAGVLPSRVQNQGPRWRERQRDPAVAGSNPGGIAWDLAAVLTSFFPA